MINWLPTALIAVAVLVAGIRLCLPPRPPRARLLALLVLQTVAAGLLYLTLQPPTRPAPAGTLVIATHAADAGVVAATPAAVRLRLPEAAVMDAVPAVPDLATALRRHPGTRELVIIGDGLPARDRDTALPPTVRFIANPPPAGLVALQAPPLLAAGARFAVGSRVQGLRGVRVELLDPSGHRADLAVPDAAGGVRLHASARDVGDSSFTLRVLDGAGKVLDQLPVPVRVQAVPAPSLRLLAAAPGPELKYLQRWAADAGATLQTGIQVGGGVQIGDAPAALDAASLARLDLLLLDERRLAALSVAQRNGIAAAMRAGLGVLVRMTGPLDAPARRALHEWGLATREGERTATIALAGQAAVQDDDTAVATAQLIERFNLGFTGSDVVPLLQAADGSAIGGWRAVGQGRLGVLPVSDSYTLVLGGQAARHAELWNDVLATLARPLPATSMPAVPGWGWSNERNTLCGLPPRIQAIAADGTGVDLLPDPAAGNCSGWWPTQPGWHTLVAGEARTTMLLLYPAQAVALHTQQMREATSALRGSDGPGNVIHVDVPGERWLWLLAFILVSALSWWLERRRPRSP